MSGEKKGFVIEPHSPYYLHPAEGPGVLITTVIFDGKNFDLWEIAVRMALKAKNKLGFIEGTLKRPAETSDEDFSEANAWDIVNSMLCSWLLNIIDPKLRMTVAYSETAYAMWNNLKRRYSVANTPKIYQLKAAIADCKQGILEVGEFYSKLTNLWNELSNHRRFQNIRARVVSVKPQNRLLPCIRKIKLINF